MHDDASTFVICNYFVKTTKMYITHMTWNVVTEMVKGDLM